jgi:hypothetical protein
MLDKEQIYQQLREGFDEEQAQNLAEIIFEVFDEMRRLLSRRGSFTREEQAQFKWFTFPDEAPPA